ncbi:hypothetical protein N431DRAFT_470409 [Stipitochalara longipes BDJ]|nr:hypothetical protein N431DRAFT_470409 [Stipitochalara longipes BDJ]
MEDIKLSSAAMGTQRRPFRGGSVENSLLGDNESTEALAMEKEERIDQSRTLDFAHRRKWNAFVCSLMIAITLPLFAFGGFALHLQHREVGSDLTHWLQFQNVSQKLATIFPILFATVVGWCLKKLAQWKLERGSTLEPLERLMGSQTFGSTIITQSKLGIFHVTAIALVLIWMLSPLGSQSSLQIVHLKQRQDNITNLTVSYFDTSVKPGFATPKFNASVSLNALFSAVLMGTDPPNPKNNLIHTDDPFGNLLIPDIPRLLDIGCGDPSSELYLYLSPNGTGWYNISSDYSGLGSLYSSSALGIPMNLSLPYSTNDVNATFTMETSFLRVNCSNNTYHTDGAFQAIPIDESLFNSATNGSLANDTYYGIKSNITYSLAINGFYQQNLYGSVWDLLNDNSTYEPRTLLFQSQTNATGGSEVTSAFCQLTTEYWESEVSCSLGVITPTACEVKSLQPSQLHHPNKNLTDLGFIGTFTSFSNSLAAASIVPPGTSSVLELYVEGSGNAPQAGIQAADLSDVESDGGDSQIDFAYLSANLQQVLNAYFYGSYDPPMYMAGEVGQNSIPPPYQRTSRVTTSQFTLTYECNPAWLLVYFLASLVMLAAAIIGTVLNHKSNAPESLGFCSEMIKDNPNIPGSHIGSALSGFARTKLFKTLKLRLVDIENENDRGYLAIVQDDGRYGQLPRKSARLYR